MGDRATIRIVQNEQVVHFYTHWDGYRIQQILAEGILNANEAGRLDDSSYAARIIFDTLTGCSLPHRCGQDGSPTGYGIIPGDENIPGDLQWDSPCISWFAWNKPVVTIWSPYSTIFPSAPAQDALEWAQATRRLTTA